MNQQEYLVSGINSFIGKALNKRYECSGVPRALFENDIELRTLVEKHDCVINLSAYGNHYHQKETNLTWRVNVGYATQLAVHSKKLINFSTSSVFLEKQTQYSLSKRVAETVMKECSHVTVRPSSVTGVGEQAHRLIPMLIRSCLYGYLMPFVEAPVHDFIDVSDVVSAVPHLESAEYNISCGNVYTNKQVREIVEDLTGKKAKVELTFSMRSYDTDKWEVDNSRLVSCGWKPIKTLEQSIKEMIDEEQAIKG